MSEDNDFLVMKAAQKRWRRAWADGKAPITREEMHSQNHMFINALHREGGSSPIYTAYMKPDRTPTWSYGPDNCEILFETNFCPQSGHLSEDDHARLAAKNPVYLATKRISEGWRFVTLDFEKDDWSGYKRLLVDIEAGKIPQPWALVASGRSVAELEGDTGMHVYWLLQHTQTNTTVVSLQTSLCRMYGSDKSRVGVFATLRRPGTIRYKDGLRWCSVIELHSKRRCKIKDFKLPKLHIKEIDWAIAEQVDEPEGVPKGWVDIAKAEGYKLQLKWAQSPRHGWVLYSNDPHCSKPTARQKAVWILDDEGGRIYHYSGGGRIVSLKTLASKHGIAIDRPQPKSIHNYAETGCLVICDTTKEAYGHIESFVKDYKGVCVLAAETGTGKSEAFISYMIRRSLASLSAKKQELFSIHKTKINEGRESVLPEGFFSNVEQHNIFTIDTKLATQDLVPRIRDAWKRATGGDCSVIIDITPQNDPADTTGTKCRNPKMLQLIGNGYRKSVACETCVYRTDCKLVKKSENGYSVQPLVIGTGPKLAVIRSHQYLLQVQPKAQRLIVDENPEACGLSVAQVTREHLQAALEQSDVNNNLWAAHYKPLIRATLSFMDALPPTDTEYDVPEDLVGTIDLSKWGGATPLTVEQRQVRFMQNGVTFPAMLGSILRAMPQGKVYCTHNELRMTVDWAKKLSGKDVLILDATAHLHHTADLCGPLGGEDVKWRIVAMSHTPVRRMILEKSDAQRGGARTKNRDHWRKMLSLPHPVTGKRMIADACIPMFKVACSKMQRALAEEGYSQDEPVVVVTYKDIADEMRSGLTVNAKTMWEMSLGLRLEFYYYEEMTGTNIIENRNAMIMFGTPSKAIPKHISDEFKQRFERINANLHESYFNESVVQTEGRLRCTRHSETKKRKLVLGVFKQLPFGWGTAEIVYDKPVMRSKYDAPAHIAADLGVVSKKALRQILNIFCLAGTDHGSHPWCNRTGRDYLTARMTLEMTKMGDTEKARSLTESCMQDQNHYLLNVGSRPLARDALRVIFGISEGFHTEYINYIQEGLQRRSQKGYKDGYAGRSRKKNIRFKPTPEQRRQVKELEKRVAWKEGHRFNAPMKAFEIVTRLLNQREDMSDESLLSAYRDFQRSNMNYFTQPFLRRMQTQTIAPVDEVYSITGFDTVYASRYASYEYICDVHPTIDLLSKLLLVPQHPRELFADHKEFQEDCVKFAEGDMEFFELLRKWYLSTPHVAEIGPLE